MKDFEFINGYHKTVIENNMVHLFELMGDRWVELGPAECWSDELIMEEFGEYLDSAEPHNHKFEVEIVNERTHRLVAHEVFEAEKEVINFMFKFEHTEPNDSWNGFLKNLLLPEIDKDYSAVVCVGLSNGNWLNVTLA